MKAKEYFERYVNEHQEFSGKSKEWKLIKTFRDIFCEAETIAKSRNAQTANAYQNIFKELNQKANSFSKMVNEIDDMGIKDNAFKLFVQAENPNFFSMIFPNGI